MKPACCDCGERPVQAKGRCYRCYKRHLRRDPEYAERDRAESRAWKQRNRDRTRAYDAAYAADPANRGVCVRCGALMSRRVRLGVCRGCRERDKLVRWRLISDMWVRGAKHGEIARRLDWSKGHLSMEMDRMRKAGWPLAYRRTPEQVARIAEAARRNGLARRRRVAA